MKRRQMCRTFFLLLLFLLMPYTAKVQAAEERTPTAYMVGDGVGRMIYLTDLWLSASSSKVELSLNADMNSIRLSDGMDFTLNLQGHQVKEVILDSDQTLTIGDSVGGGRIKQVEVAEKSVMTLENAELGEVLVYGTFIMKGGSVTSDDDIPYDMITGAVNCCGRFEMFGGTVYSKSSGIVAYDGADILIHNGTIRGDWRGITCKSGDSLMYLTYLRGTESNPETATVQIDGGTITGYVPDSYDTDYDRRINCGALVLGGAEKVTLNGGEYFGRAILCENILDTDGVTTMNCTIQNCVFHNEVYIGPVCNVTINSGTFYAGLGHFGDGTVTIQNGTFQNGVYMDDINDAYMKKSCALFAIPTGAGRLCVNGGSYGNLFYGITDSSTGTGVSLAGGTFCKAEGENQAVIQIKDGTGTSPTNLLSLLASGYTYAGDPDYVDDEKMYMSAPNKIEIKTGRATLPVHILMWDTGKGAIRTPNDKMCIYGAAYGAALPPISTRSGYTFDGWYTEKTGGTKVTASTIFHGYEDTILYPHWTKNPDTGGTTTPSKPSTGGTTTPSKPSTGGTTTSGKPKLSAAKLTLTVGQKSTLKVTGSSKKVTWKTSNKKIATVSNGKVTAKKKGTATITATVGGKKLTCKVTVKAKTPKLNKTSAILNKGKTLSLKVTNASGKVKWKSSNTKVATVSGSGKVKAKKAGTATITATVGGKKLTCKVTVGGKVYKEQNEIYEVGDDMPAGKYRLVPQKDQSVYTILKSAHGKEKNERLKNEKTVTLKKGWFIMLSGCYAVQLS